VFGWRNKLSDGPLYFNPWEPENFAVVHDFYIDICEILPQSARAEISIRDLYKGKIRL
jgi:hypothetical protein